MEIKYENLMRMYNHVLLNVKEEEFDLSYFLFRNIMYPSFLRFHKEDLDESFYCGTVGCVIGHCSILDIENVNKNFSSYVKLGDGTYSFEIEFEKWGEYFTGINFMKEDSEDPYEYSLLWLFLFSADWPPLYCTKEHVLARMKMFIETRDPDRCVSIYENFLEEVYQKDFVASYNVSEEFFKQKEYEI